MAARAKTSLRIGTRGSALALWQARWIQSRLQELGCEAEIEIIRTRGDKVQNVPLPQIGGKGLFTAELEAALREGNIDVAVHSLKDLPTGLPPEFVLGAVPARADARDVLLAVEPFTLASLPRGARVGTSSPRRAGQLRAVRSDLEILDLRGNVDTRIRKLEAGEYDAIVLAAAGAERLGLTALVREHIAPQVVCPCPGQGALAVEARTGDEKVLAQLQALEHAATRFAVEVERIVLAELGGGCSIPVGVYCAPQAESCRVYAAVCKPDGSGIVRLEESVSLLSFQGEAEESSSHAVAQRVAIELRQQGAEEMLAP